MQAVPPPLEIQEPLGCAGCTMIVIKVPVIQRTVPPAELLAAIPPSGQTISAPGASSVACLDPAEPDTLLFRSHHPRVIPAELL